MTEQTSFGGLAVADPRTATPTPDFTDESTGNDRRKLAIVGAVAAVVVVLIAAFFLMKGSGGSTTTPAATSAAPPASTAGAGTTGAAKPAKAVKMPKSFAGVIGRDPFKPLYVAPASKSDGSGSPAGSTTTPDTTGGTTTVPVTTPTTGGTTTPTTGSTGSSGSLTGVGTNYVPVWVELVRVDGTKSATFVVGYTNGKRSRTVTYSDITAPTSTVRTVFAKIFSLLSIQSGTATVQVGDGTPFDLKRGFSNRHYLG